MTKKVVVLGKVYTDIRNYFIIENPHPISSDEYNDVWQALVPTGMLDTTDDNEPVYDYPRKVTISCDNIVERCKPFEIIVLE